jgi:hypothetical protein
MIHLASAVSAPLALMLRVIGFVPGAENFTTDNGATAKLSDQLLRKIRRSP